MTSDREPMSGDDLPVGPQERASSSNRDEAWTFDGIDTALLDDLTIAMRGQADRFEPSHDSYRRLAEAVNQRSRPSTVRWFRPLAVAALVVAAVGLGASLVATQNQQKVGTAPGSEVAIGGEPPDGGSSGDGSGSAGSQTDDTGSGAATSEIAAADQAADGSGDGSADSALAASAGGELTGPVRSTELEAAQAFLDLLRLPYGAPEVVDGRVVVRSYGEGATAGSNNPIAATLTLAEVDGGFAVVEATTRDVVIASVSGGDLADGRLEVAGAGTGFESTVGIRVVSAIDNRVLATGSARAGNFGQPAPFTGEVPVVGAEQAWVVVSGGGGADGVIEPFAAKPVSFRAGADDTQYSVVRVASDDPDGGLHIRTGPGGNNESLGVIPPGTGGILRLDDYPVLVGTEPWWSVVTPDATRGWVNGRFLASTRPVPEAELIALAQRLGAGVSAGFQPGPDLPVTRRAKVAVGPVERPVGVDPRSLFTAEGWNQAVSVPPPASGGNRITTGLADLLRMDLWSDADVRVGPDYGSAASQAAAHGYFGDLPSVVITPRSPASTGSDPAGTPAGQILLFAESTPEGPEIVGLVVEQPQP